MSSPPATSAADERRPPSTVWSGCVSLLFWMCLVTAAALYAGVSLAPKLVAWQDWERQYQANQLELVTLEARSTQLEQVVAALKDDPQFAAELVRQEFDAQVPGEEVIPVSHGLSFHPRATAEDIIPPAALRPQPWEPYVTALATQQPLRRALLGTAAALVILGFTFLHDQHSRRGRSLWQALRERYAAE
jgi:cell division protein FtsB